jgi:hypothetical protein
MPVAVLGAGTFSTTATTRLLSGDDEAFVGIGGAAAGAGWVAAAADERLVGLQEAAERPGRVFAQPVAQLVRHGPGGLVGDAEFALKELGRHAALVAGHQIGGQEPLRQRRPGPVQHRPGGDRLLMMAGAALVDPRARLQPPALAATTRRTFVAARPAQRRQMLEALLLGSEPPHKLQ